MRHRLVVAVLLAVLLAACRGPELAPAAQPPGSLAYPSTARIPHEPYPFGSQIPVSDRPLWSSVPAASATPPTSCAASPPLDPPAADSATATADPACSPVVSGAGLRELWPVSSVRPTGALVYTRERAVDPDQRSSILLWQVDLPDPQQSRPLLQATSDSSTLVGALISPDGNWIAYLRATGQSEEDGFDLRVVRRDGTDDHLVAEDVPFWEDPWCDVGPLLWSPDSTSLAFMRFWATGYLPDNRVSPDARDGQEIFMYDLIERAPPRLLLSVVKNNSSYSGHGELIGWHSPTQLLARITLDGDRPRTLEAIDIATSERKVLLKLRQSKEFCRPPAPETELLLMSDLYSFQVLDPVIDDLRDIRAPGHHAVWNTTGTALLSYEETGLVRIVPVDPASPIQSARVIPPGANGRTLQLSGVSPDGRYLAVCEAAMIKSRTWLYDVSGDRWWVVAGEPSCVDVVGWLPAQ